MDKGMMNSNSLVGKAMKLELDEPHQYGKLGTFDVTVIERLPDSIGIEMYLLKPKGAPITVLGKYSAHLFAVGPMGGYAKGEYPVMPKILAGQVVNVCVNFLEDESAFNSIKDALSDKLQLAADVKFGCYGSLWMTQP